MKKIMFCFIISCCIVSQVLAGNTGEKIFFPGQPSFGVQIHTSMNGKEMAAVGFKWVRLDVAWGDIEVNEKGEYDFSRHDKEVAHYLDNGMKILGLLAYHNRSKFYPHPKDDFDATVKAYSAFCRACAKHFKGKIALWELGNEPQSCYVGGVYVQPANYTRIARAAAGAIREVDRDVSVGALSLAWMDRPFVLSCMEKGLLCDGTIDVITYHGYHRANIMPESGLRKDIVWLRSVIDKYKPDGMDMIVVDSERGYPLREFLAPKSWAAWRNLVYFESEQAAYLARHFLEEMSAGIEVSIWYKDMSDHDSIYEAGFGSRIRPIGYVMRNLSSLIDANPKELFNSKYKIALSDIPDKIGNFNSTVKLRSFLREYKSESSRRDRLIIAAWNPVEAFDGKILHSRQQIGDYFYEAWRAVSPEDNVKVPTQMIITVPEKMNVKKIYICDLLSKQTSKMRKSLGFELNGWSITTDKIEIGPMPTILELELGHK